MTWACALSPLIGRTGEGYPLRCIRVVTDTHSNRGVRHGRLSPSKSPLSRRAWLIVLFHILSLYIRWTSLTLNIWLNSCLGGVPIVIDYRSGR